MSRGTARQRRVGAAREMVEPRSITLLGREGEAQDGRSVRHGRSEWSIPTAGDPENRCIMLALDPVSISGPTTKEVHMGGKHEGTDQKNGANVAGRVADRPAFKQQIALLAADTDVFRHCVTAELDAGLIDEIGRKMALQNFASGSEPRRNIGDCRRNGSKVGARTYGVRNHGSVAFLRPVSVWGGIMMPCQWTRTSGMIDRTKSLAVCGKH